MERVPLVYFYGLLPGKYIGCVARFVSGGPLNLAFTIAVDDVEHAQPGLLLGEDGQECRRRYVTASFRVRLHQRPSGQVLQAYGHQCAFCQLRHAELLDAAHITPDRDPRENRVATASPL